MKIPEVPNALWDWLLVAAAIIGGGSLLGAIAVGLFISAREALK